MANRYFKVVIYTPTKSLFSYLYKNLVYQNLELFYLPTIEELEQYVQRVKPKLAIVYVSNEPEEFRETLQTIQKISAIEDLWLLLVLNKDLSIQKLRSSLPVKRVILQTEDDDYQLVAHNLLSIRNIDHTLSRKTAQNQFEENINHCLRIVYEEKNLPRAFERLVNYFPKMIHMDYWGIFTVDKQMRHIAYFAQFIPPTKRDRTMLSKNLEVLAKNWLSKGRPFLSTRKENPEVFQKLAEWGWPIEQVYFLPIHLKDRVVGGMLVGSLATRQLNAQEIRFLNEVIDILSRRILDENLTETEDQEVSEFSDQLISNHFDETAVFQNACKKMNQVTRAASTIFWQYNKGFGFLFPKYYHFLEGNRAGEPHDKDMIFLNKESFLSRLINRGKIRTLENVTDENRLEAATKEIFHKLQYEQVLIMPVKIQNEITGALIVNKLHQDDQFTISEIHKAEEIIKRTQIVIEDAQTVKEANLKLKQLSRVFDLGSELKLDLKLKEILERITKNLRRTLGWNDIAILLETASGKSLRVSNLVGFKQKLNSGIDFSKNVPSAAFQEILKRCEPISNSYFYDSQAVAPSGLGVSTLSQKITEWHNNDLLITPLETRGRVLGYLVVHDPVDRLKPTVEKISPLAYYGNQVAVTVENSLLYEDLRTSQERYRSLAETMSLSLVTCSLNGKIFYVNPAFEQLVGFTEKELLGKSLGRYFSKDSQQGLIDVVKKLAAKESDKSTQLENLEFNLVGNSGEEIPVSVFGFPFFERSAKTGFFLVLSDLRVIKKLERMKADFNSMIVHDLRSPMNVIQGFLELIRNRVVGEINSEQEELLDIAKENVKKVLALVDNFLVASKMEVGKFSVEPKLGEINGLVRQQVQNHRVLAKNKNINVHIELDPDLPMLFFDSQRIDQVLNNLLSNAMKFTPENGDIYVNSSVKNDDQSGENQQLACISVKDTGVGIPAEKLPQVFEKYEQVDSNQHYNVRGTGLGLSICKEIINLHGGDIWVESLPEKGSNFSFTLPIAPAVEQVIEHS